MRTSELKGGGDVTISLFLHACGCCAPRMFLFPFHFVAAVRPSELTLFFSLAHGRYALTGQ